MINRPGHAALICGTDRDRESAAKKAAVELLITHTHTEREEGRERETAAATDQL